LRVLPMKTFLPQNQFNSDVHVPVASGSAADSPLPPSKSAAALSVSPGDLLGSLPSGESDPSVMLDWAPGEPEAAVVVRTAAASDCTCGNLQFVYECIDGTILHRCKTCGRKAYLSATDDIPEILRGHHALNVISRTASDTSDIPEIFRVANLLCEDARIFTPDYPSIYQAMLDPNAPRAFEGDPTWADPAPLFLKDTA
jgi:hypothetical protein